MLSQSITKWLNQFILFCIFWDLLLKNWAYRYCSDCEIWCVTAAWWYGYRARRYSVFDVHIFILLFFFKSWLLHTTLTRQLLALTLCEWKEYLGTYLLLATPQQQLEHFSKQNLSVLVGVLMPCPPSDFSTIQLPNAIMFLIYTHSISSSVNIYGPLSFSIFFSILQKLINMTKRIYETFWKLSVSFVIYCLQTISWYERTSHSERRTCVRTLQELDKSENLRTCKVGSSAGTNQHSPLIYTG